VPRYRAATIAKPDVSGGFFEVKTAEAADPLKPFSVSLDSLGFPRGC
jgi:hypothetical protein